MVILNIAIEIKLIIHRVKLTLQQYILNYFVKIHGLLYEIHFYFDQVA